MDKKEILKEIVDVIKPSFDEVGFHFKSPNKFEYKNGNSLYIYEIDVAKSKTGHSLHLKLFLQNKEISNAVNQIMKLVLTDKETIFPENWTPKIIKDVIKERTSNKNILGLTDWRFFKDKEKTLEAFNKEFSIWFSTFKKLGDKKNWKEELIKSVHYAKYWFSLVNNKNYLIEHTEYVALYLLKQSNELQKLAKKYENILNKKKLQNQDTTEIRLFYKYLLNRQ